MTMQRHEFSVKARFDVGGGLTALHGRSGAGKTTVINAIAGLIAPDSGRIVLGDQVLFDAAAGINLPPHRRGIGYVFQAPRLFPHMTVARNLTYARRFRTPGPDAPSLDHIAKLLGIEHLLHRSPAHLSGGEKQRVALGRALLSGPRLLLADEPLSALDDTRKSEIMPYFEQLRDDLAIPILYVSHSVPELLRLANYVVTMDQGRVLRCGSVADILGDPNANTGSVRGLGALITAQIVQTHADGVMELDSNGQSLFVANAPDISGDTAQIYIAAQDVMLATVRPQGLSALNVLPGVVDKITAVPDGGAVVTVRTKVGGLLSRITTSSCNGLGLTIGVECYAIVKTVAITSDSIRAAGNMPGQRKSAD
jgi:molybdate transport system ATP-binding protein